jgi:predicted glycosyltransferase
MSGKRKKVLVAPLNWGLGHASRCVPVIRALENSGAEVFIASDGVAMGLMQAEFPYLPCFMLPSYGIRYYSSNMVLNIARQMPRILYAAVAEYRATDRIVRKYDIQGIISDNRYGCFHHLTRNVLITHQLNLRIPGKPLEYVTNQLLRLALKPFGDIWVPDTDSHDGLSGVLSHPPAGLNNTSYIGILSRATQAPAQEEPEYDAAVVLSGPEPQRTLLEQLLLDQASRLPYRFMFVQGITGAKIHSRPSENISMVSYMTGAELNRLYATSKFVVCRSGYSSLMDLAASGKKGVLIPTPGQTEQEYLARHLSESNRFVAQEQTHIDLGAALRTVGQTTGLSGAALRLNDFESQLNLWLDILGNK